LQHIQDLIGSNDPPNKARAAHEGQWELSKVFEDKLAHARAQRLGRSVKSGFRRADFAEEILPDGRRAPLAEPLGIPVARVKGGSVDLASDRFEHDWKVPAGS
jgi:hypothetical protein